jgi:hypothetical protein
MLLPVKGYEDNYTVSDEGFVLSNRTKTRLKRRISNCGYARIVLYKEGIPKQFSLHRLVATHFKLIPGNKPCVNHKDGNKNNCRVDNLEWCTYSENARHAISIGLWRYRNSNKNGKLSGEGNGRSKLTERQVMEIRKQRKFGSSVKEICASFNMKDSQIYNILNYVSWA